MADGSVALEAHHHLEHLPNQPHGDDTGHAADADRDDVVLVGLGRCETENTEHHDETEDALNGQHLKRTFCGIHAEINVDPNGIKGTVGHAADQHQSKIHDEQKRASDGHPCKNNV